MIAPIFVVAAATMLEWALRFLPVGAHRTLAAAIAAAIVLSGGLALYRRLTELRAAFPVIYQSAFGQVASVSTPRSPRSGINSERCSMRVLRACCTSTRSPATTT